MGRTLRLRACDCGRMAAYADCGREKTSCVCVAAPQYPSCGAPAPVRCHATMRIGLSVPTRGTDSPDPTRPALFDTPIDAGRWMPALGVATPLFGPRGAGTGALDDRLYLVAHIADPSPSPRLACLLARYRARYVYYGAAVPPLAHRHLNVARLLADDRLRLVYSSVAVCRPERARSRGACPPAGSYVFAVRLSFG